MNLEPVLSQGVPPADKSSLMRGKREKSNFFCITSTFDSSVSNG